MSSQTSEDSGFGTMRVHDLRLVIRKHSQDRSQGSTVLKRIQASAKFRKNSQIQSEVQGSLFERTFRAEPWPGDQTDFITKQVLLVVHVEERVFLSTADDQPSNDVGNAHQCFLVQEFRIVQGISVTA